VKGGELSEFLGKEIVEGDSRFVPVCLHFLAHIHDRGVELGVARRKRELLLEEAVADAIAFGLILAGDVRSVPTVKRDAANA
jgi:hypothetical protein